MWIGVIINGNIQWSFKNAVGIASVASIDTLLFANSTSINFFKLQDDNVVSFYLLKCEYYSLEIIQYFMSTVRLLNFQIYKYIFFLSIFILTVY